MRLKLRNRPKLYLLSCWAIALLLAGCSDRSKKENESPENNPAAAPENNIMKNSSPLNTFSKPAPPAPAPVQVKLQTTLGDIILELNPQAAPLTTQNFLCYVKEGFYNGTVFHRVIEGFMIQGGGFTPDMQQKETHPPIKNEAANGWKNERGTVAMARLSDPHSATSQFFINHRDNPPLNYGSSRSPDGYAVFGKVIQGMDVVDKIAAVRTGDRDDYQNVPLEPVIIESAALITTP